MSIFTLDIKCDNAAFDPEPGLEIARILRSVAYDAERGQLQNLLFDINGNYVGATEITEDKE